MEKRNNGFDNLHEWSNRMQGAREMLIKLYEENMMIMPVCVKRSEDRIYTKAIVTLLMSDLKNIQEYLFGTNFGFRNHVRDKKGKLISCEAYFAKKTLLGFAYTFACNLLAFLLKQKLKQN